MNSVAKEGGTILGTTQVSKVNLLITGLEDLTDAQWGGGLQDFMLFACSTMHKCLPGGLIDALLKTALRAT